VGGGRDGNEGIKFSTKRTSPLQKKVTCTTDFYHHPVLRYSKTGVIICINHYPKQPLNLDKFPMQ
jgi:hypothetical protein